MDLVTAFKRRQGLGHVSHWVSLAINQLRQDTSYCILGTVHFYPDGCIILRNGKDWHSAETPFQHIKGILLFNTPLSRLLPNYFMQRSGILAEVLNEMPLEIDKVDNAQKILDSLLVG